MPSCQQIIEEEFTKFGLFDWLQVQIEWRLKEITGLI